MDKFVRIRTEQAMQWDHCLYVHWSKTRQLFYSSTFFSCRDLLDILNYWNLLGCRSANRSNLMANDDQQALDEWKPFVQIEAGETICYSGNCFPLLVTKFGKKKKHLLPGIYHFLQFRGVLVFPWSLCFPLCENSMHVKWLGSAIVTSLPGDFSTSWVSYITFTTFKCPMSCDILTPWRLTRSQLETWKNAIEGGM